MAVAAAVLTAVLGGLVAGLPVASVAAGATPVDPRVPSVPSVPSAQSGPSVVVTPVPHAGVRAYWTPERMREAIPLDLDPAGGRIASAPGTAAPRLSARTGEGLRSTGKLFFTDGRSDFVCSGAAVSTPEKDLVLTAGHCVNTGGVKGLLGGCRAGSYFSGFLFVPAYDHDARPYGTWVGTSVATPNEWVTQCDLYARDQAMIRVAPLGGRNLVDVVGGNGLAWNYPAREDGVRVVGWPAEAPYDGQSRQECVASTVGSTRTNTPADAEMACPLTGGASGGPWFVRMASADTGFIFAVTSRRPTDGTPLLFATPFDASIETLLAVARSAPRPVSRPVAGRVTGRVTGDRPKRGARLRLAATAGVVGFGESYRLVAETRRVRRIVLQVRDLPGAPWRRLASARVRGGVTVFDQSPPPGTRWYRVKVRGAKRHSAPVAVTVGACPLPLDRSPGVVSATRCTSPVG
ncbi:trypsin-like serine peptidase [Nocardioides daeguensis]|uniref:Trypsin-like serine protease n=1 Tax=Nocardioides daeguensis TaxID=908359 RepID=A0ABP6W0G5_9ACTN|nr:hypothetical protein [Nocardioides daeguensis]MBV6726787.1 hypothetical protein [Nocardioides daeguensis]MCR1774461.1 hypothetical protein [Nocardioides daeguensis]